MPRFIASIAFAFLLGITLAGCAEVTAARKALVENSFTVGTKVADVFPNASDRSGGE